MRLRRKADADQSTPFVFRVIGIQLIRPIICRCLGGWVVRVQTVAPVVIGPRIGIPVASFTLDDISRVPRIPLVAEEQIVPSVMLVAYIEFDIVLLGRRKRINQAQAIEPAAPAGTLPYDRLKPHFC